MKKVITIVLALALALSLTACSNGPDRQPAIDAFNKAVTLFDTVAAAINEDPSAFDQDTIDSISQIGTDMERHKATIEGKDPVTQEHLNDLIAWFNSVEEVMAETMEAYGIQ